MDGHNFERLKAHILSISIASDFDQARKEWSLTAIELSDDWDICPCGQDIKEHCHIRNVHSGLTTYVGNVCIKRFIGIDTGNLFDGLRRINENPRANANFDLIEYANKNGYLFDREYKFLKDTMLKKKPSKAQLAWKEKINRRIIAGTVVQKRSQT